jgi:formylglycine-generating enzyme required for sulfatase activity
MVRIPAGSFEMGAADERAAVRVDTFQTVAFQQPAPSARPVERPQEPPPRPRAMPRPSGPLRPNPRQANTNEAPARPKQQPRGPKRPEPAAEPRPEPVDDEAERPRHVVAVGEFFASRYEVTQAQWRVVAGLPRIDRDLNPSPSEFKGDSLPVDNVSWEDAVEFCKRLSAKTGRGYRLPTEAEWEYACRAGSAAPFAFGATITPDLVNYDGGFPFGAGPRGVSRRKTVPVGGLGIANAFGLSDMHGNVAEWCFDPWHADYTGAPGDAAAWEQGGDANFRVLRGGSWINAAADCRSSRRVNNAAGNRNSDVGFRIVMVR